MKTKNGLFYLGIMLIVVGCAKIEEPTSYDSPEPPIKTFKTIGTLEVQEPVQELTNQKSAWAGVEVLTVSLADTPTAGELYKARLKTKLASVAKEKYGADAVVNVSYWPDPESGDFPEGLVHARGDMVRYQKFPTAEVTAS